MRTTKPIRTLKAAYMAGRLRTRGRLDPAGVVAVARLKGIYREAHDLGCRDRGRPFRITDEEIMLGIISRLRFERDRAEAQLGALTTRCALPEAPSSAPEA